LVAEVVMALVIEMVDGGGNGRGGWDGDGCMLFGLEDWQSGFDFL
jgi:hypothetical protein